MMNSSHREKPVTEKMFQDLFFAFVRIFDLQIHDTSDSSSYFFRIDNKVVISEPDAVICKFTELESTASSQLELSVFAVVDVTKYYSKAKEEDDILEHLRSSAKTTQSVAEHVNCKTKLQHIGEMLAVTQSSSAFGMNGVFGFIVQGTKVTLASLEVSDDFF